MDIDSTVAGYTYKAFYWPEDGLYLAKCEEFPGLRGEGNEKADALEDLQNQIRERLEKGEKKP